MIVKYFELKKKNLGSYKYFLLYGANDGLIEETISNIIKPSLPKNLNVYEESEILKDELSFIENISNNSFFEK